MAKRPPVVDTDEHGYPVRDEYRRLGAGSVSGDDEGLYVRFETGFGTNVYIGHRIKPDFGYPREAKDHEKMGLSIVGWEHLCELVDEWRSRKDG